MSDSNFWMSKSLEYEAKCQLLQIQLTEAENRVKQLEQLVLNEQVKSKPYTDKDKQ